VKKNSNAVAPKPTVVVEPANHDMQRVLERLHFNPAEGMIWLEDRRMVLMHMEAFGALRQELIESVGIEGARGLLTRIGYTTGCRDAELAMKIHGQTEALEELLLTGAQLHALQGIVATEKSFAEIDIEKGICHLEFFWRNSFEDHTHTLTYGVGNDPACWMEIGYSSGYLSTCMGRRILVREVECRSMGQDVCRCVAKPVEQWSDPEVDLKYFEPAPVRLQYPASVAANAQATALAPMAPRQPPGSGHGVIGASVPFNIIMHKIHRVAPTSATVLLLGESGVGKSAFANEVHRLSRRVDKPFVELNCAAIPEQLMESELFGAERGAFTGAGEGRPGRFTLADGGTLFLDEIGTLSMTAQGKLLRVIQTGQFEPLGSAVTKTVDVRIVAATNENLHQAMKDGRFREDLFYRINVFPIVVAPLRERRDDIPLLLEHLIRKYSTLHSKQIPGVTARALQVIFNYSWPGNVRELENVIERGVILGDEGQALSYQHLFTVDSSARDYTHMALNELGQISEHRGDADVTQPVSEAESQALSNWADGIVERSSATLFDVEDTLVNAAFKAANGNMSRAATLLGITRAQLAYRVKKLREVKP
jgi:DNA-binding NtrC family response regulator/predicted hydrocarbon binding protein